MVTTPKKPPEDEKLSSAAAILTPTKKTEDLASGAGGGGAGGGGGGAAGKGYKDIARNKELDTNIESLSSAALRVIAALLVREPAKEEPSGYSFLGMVGSAVSSVLGTVTAAATTVTDAASIAINVHSIYKGAVKIGEDVLKGTPEEIDRKLVQLEEGVTKVVGSLTAAINDIENYDESRERLGVYIGMVKGEIGEEIKKMDKKDLIELIEREAKAYLARRVEEAMQAKLAKISSELIREGALFFAEIKEKNNDDLASISVQNIGKIISETDENKILLAIFKSNMALAMIKEGDLHKDVYQALLAIVKIKEIAHAEAVCGVMYDEAERYVKEKQLAVAGVEPAARVPDAIGGAGAIASPRVVTDGGVLEGILDSTVAASAASAASMGIGRK